MSNKIAILGTGAWGTALANVLLENNNHVAMWGIDEEEINDLNNQCNSKYYGHKKLNRPLNFATKEITHIIDFYPDIIILAVPSIHIENTINLIISRLKNKPIFINVAKGFNQKTLKTWSYTIDLLIKNKSKGLVTLIGPSFATEVFKKAITIVNIISSNNSILKIVKNVFETSYFKCIIHNDVKGAECISALKNVMAIASGIIYAQHTSINTRSAILAQIAREISYIIEVMGGEKDTLYQFCGIGDIFLTCTSSKSRNFSFGKNIGKSSYRKMKKKLKTLTIEGYWSTKIAYQIIKKYHIPAPIITHIYKTLYENENEKKFIQNIIPEID